MMLKEAYNWTSEEKALVADELTQRIKDLMSVVLRPRVVAVLDEMWEGLDPLRTMDDILFTYTFNMCTGDIFQVLGRLRNNEEE